MGNCPPWNPETMQKIVEMFWGRYQQESPDNRRETKKIRGTVVLMKKNILDLSDLGSSFLDRVHELMGRGVSLQLVSSVHVDPGKFLSFFLFYNQVSGSAYAPRQFLCNYIKIFTFIFILLLFTKFESLILRNYPWEIIAVLHNVAPQIIL